MARGIFPAETQGRHCVFTGLLKNIAFGNCTVFVVFFSTPGKSCMGITMSFPCSDMPLRIMLTMLMGFTLPCALTEAFQLLSHSSTSHRVSESAHSTPVFIYFFVIVFVLLFLLFGLFLLLLLFLIFIILLCIFFHPSSVSYAALET